jgi:hypothetical protein
MKLKIFIILAIMAEITFISYKALEYKQEALRLKYNHYNLVKATPMDIACVEAKGNNAALTIACDNYYNKTIWWGKE